MAHYPELAARVRSQRAALPELYRDIDFGALPDRFTTDPGVPSALPQWVADREPFLADQRMVELMGAATLLGDVVADAYAALAGTHGAGRLIGMLQKACRDGINAVPHAPVELVHFIETMEATPDWIDWDQVEEGARHARVSAALLAPFVIRGAFVATFTNTYSALPMALTGALSGERAARRVNDTASFFAVTTLPGALRRYGPGFEAAAMVRLVHSMVRYQALAHSPQWDAAVYGMPVPQVDQMPAGLIGQYLLAQRALRAGRHTFDQSERAAVEFARYRCFLLGLPEELLPTDPGGIVGIVHARAALLRDGFDDATCGALVRATMEAYLRPRDSRTERIADSVEKSWSALAFTKAFCNGDRAAAATMGVTVAPADIARVGVTAPFVLGRRIAARQAARVPGLRRLVDAYAVRLLRRRLETYGRPLRTDPPPGV